MPKPALYIMVGYPGSGKTTVAQHISKITGAVHLWASKERIERFHEHEYLAANSSELYSQLNNEAEAMLTNGQSVVYDTNFRFRPDREHMKEIADKAGAEYRLIWVQVPREVARTRAVEDSADKPTRLWGNMPDARFDRLSDDFDKPGPEEKPITIQGINVDEHKITKALGLI